MQNDQFTVRLAAHRSQIYPECYLEVSVDTTHSLLFNVYLMVSVSMAKGNVRHNETT